MRPVCATFARLWAVVAAIAVATVLQGCASQQPEQPPADEKPAPTEVSVVLDGSAAPQRAALLIAEEKGFFEDVNIILKIEQPQDGESCLDAVQELKAAYCFAGQDELAAAFGCDEPYSVLAVAAMGPVQASQDAAGKEPPSYDRLLVASDLFLVRLPDTARAFSGALQRSCTYIAKHPDAARAKLEKLTPDASDEERASWVEQVGADYEAAREWGSIDQKVWDDYFAWAYENSKIDNKIPAHHGYSLDYLDEAR